MNIVPDRDLWDMCYDCNQFNPCASCKGPERIPEFCPCRRCGVDIGWIQMNEQGAWICPSCGNKTSMWD